MTGLKPHDQLQLRDNITDELIDIEVIMVDDDRNLATVYCADEDWLAVYAVTADTHGLVRVKFQRTLEPWESAD